MLILTSTIKIFLFICVQITFYFLAKPKQNGHKHHRILPNNFIENIAHLNGKPHKRSMRMPETKSVDYHVEEKKHIHHRNHIKKEEVPQVNYILTRGMTETIHCKYNSMFTANR